MSENRTVIYTKTVTGRLAMSTLPSSGQHGKRRTLKQIVGNRRPIDEVCPCGEGIGCYRVTDPNDRSPCDFVVS